MSQKQSFGIMDEGYFVPRTEILDWLNNLLKLNLTKIQQLGSGAVYCQVIDVIYPGKVTMNKVNWKARNDYQFIANLKILQTAFDKVGIKRYVEVEKLARAKYQDNLQFIQWLKRYYDLNCGQRGNNYMAQERRGSTVVDFGFAEKNVIPKTYNGSGQVIPKSQKPQPPKKQINTNIVSAVAAYRSQNKQKQPRRQNIIHNSNKKADPKDKTKDLQKQKVRELEQKIAMIKQIAESSQSAETRMKLIQQVLSINNQHANIESEQQLEHVAQKIEQQQVL